MTYITSAVVTSRLSFTPSIFSCIKATFKITDVPFSIQMYGISMLIRECYITVFTVYS